MHPAQEACTLSTSKLNEASKYKLYSHCCITLMAQDMRSLGFNLSPVSSVMMNFRTSVALRKNSALYTLWMICNTCCSAIKCLRALHVFQLLLFRHVALLLHCCQHTVVLLPAASCNTDIHFAFALLSLGSYVTPLLARQRGWKLLRRKRLRGTRNLFGFCSGPTNCLRPRPSALRHTQRPDSAEIMWQGFERRPNMWLSFCAPDAAWCFPRRVPPQRGYAEVPLASRRLKWFTKPSLMSATCIYLFNNSAHAALDDILFADFLKTFCAYAFVHLQRLHFTRSIPQLYSLIMA